jgi:homoserine kinase type II
MATFTQLDDDDLSVIATAFDLGAVRACERIFAGTINSNFALDTERGRFALRVNGSKSPAEVHDEAELVNALADAGVPVPRPRRTRSGEPLLIDDRGRLVCSVFPWVQGTHVLAPDIGPGHTSALGRALARLHLAGLPLASRFTRVSRVAYGRIANIARGLFGHEDPALAAALDVVRQEIAWLEAHAEERAAATVGVVHNDLFPDNVFFAHAAGPEPEIVAIIDFEDATSGSLAFDLAVCINAWCGDDSTHALGPAGADPVIDVERVRALVAGYESLRPLPEADARALALELRASAVIFTVTRITDVYLPGIDKPDKDFRHFLRRLEHWRAIHVMDLLARPN